MKIKRILALVALAILVTAGARQAYSAAYDVQVIQRNSADDDEGTRSIPVPAGEYRLWGTTSGQSVFSFKLGQNLQYDADNLEIDCNCLSATSTENQINMKADLVHIHSMENVTNLNLTIGNINSQLHLVTATTSGFMASADKVKLNATPMMARAKLQTNTSGVLTWTFPTSTPFSAEPIISAVPEDNVAGVSIDVKVTSISSSSVSIQISKVSTVLGVLQFTANPQSYVHLTAIGL